MSEQVAELEGSELDYWVAKAIRWEHYDGYDGKPLYDPARAGGWVSFRPSDLWSSGGPLIQEWQVDIVSQPQGHWEAGIYPHPGLWSGATPLEAACRAIVASVYGETVPEEDDA